jgi:hypothetical protein
MAGLTRLPHQLVAGIGDERRAGIADQRHCLALGESGKQLRPLLFRIVIVIGDERRDDAVVAQEHGGDPGILAGDQIGSGQRCQSANRNIAEIADGRGDDMEAGRQRTGGQPVPVNGEEPPVCALGHRIAALSGPDAIPPGLPTAS